ncbi:methionine adenosyltransferase [Mycoplasma sp. T363T]|uniref:methionine adenosyltransferase n=1 Tax=Mycoplasma bradburyae TaxID=2963128 RepID=UPI002341FA14|nr:methionine adenosyltransferase [Mycoplasma bradburyae]MDC4163477.1 methionine adenosyltransferase [Mycoplasma bradburyae]
MEHNRRGVYTAESVGSGHPDKICDQIADGILDECLKQDENSRVACEVVAANRLIVIAGEITTKAKVDHVKIAWDVVTKLGYDRSSFTIISNINQQSPDIAQSVDQKNNMIGAGDQGITVGYACNETNNQMPLAVVMAHDLVKLARELINNQTFNHAKYDMKAQVSLNYLEDNQVELKTILMSIQHEENIDLSVFKLFVKKFIMDEIATKYGFSKDYEALINPSGLFTSGGPIADTGLTGRKLLVDSFGIYAHHGGGAYSGKDYTKVDRSGAYYARWIAKHIIKAKLATQCEVIISWAIGVPKPLDISINCFDTNTVDMKTIYKIIKKIFNHNLAEIINILKLRTTKYSGLATYGHFGKSEKQYAFENTIYLDEILKML